MKIAKIILFICKYIAGITLYLFCLKSLDLWFKLFKHEKYIEYFMFFGLGVLLYYPLKYILNNNK